jgi:carbonic anhydrase
MNDDPELLAGYHRYRRKIADQQPELAALAQGQSPHALWIGCSDSRVIPEEITDADPGELLVLRNVANIVPPAGTDDSVGSIVEFAVLSLRVGRIIVCGHTDCGGVAALSGQLDQEREPQLARWVELARPAEARVAALDLPGAERAVETIKANVLVQRDRLLAYPCVAAGLRAGTLSVQAALYTLHTGEVLVFSDARQAWLPLPLPPD